MQNRDFKGVWIPKEVWLDERLNALDKVILIEIDSLDNEKGCYASNDSLAEFCQCSASKVSKSIKKLIDFGYLYVESFDGRKRTLRSCLAKNARLDDKKCEADEQNVPTNNIPSNIGSNNTPYSPPRDRSQKTELTIPSQQETGFSDRIQSIFEDWLKYKKESRKFVYKETGLKNLIAEIKANVQRYNETIVEQVIRRSISNSWSGIIWDQCQKIQQEIREQNKNEKQFPF